MVKGEDPARRRSAGFSDAILPLPLRKLPGSAYVSPQSIPPLASHRSAHAPSRTVNFVPRSSENKGKEGRLPSDSQREQINFESTKCFLCRCIEVKLLDQTFSLSSVYTSFDVVMHPHRILPLPGSESVVWLRFK